MLERNKRYTAKLTTNLRDIHTTVPKRLFVNVTDEDGVLFRDHCWVLDTKDIQNVAPTAKTKNKPIKVMFTADIKEYKRGGVEQAFTLEKIRGLKQIK